MTEETQLVKRVPDEIQDITPQWFSTILGKKVSPSGFKLTPNVQAGTGFLSTLIRVTFETEEDSEFHHVIVKLLPAEDDKAIGETRELVLGDNYDRTEILAYKILIPELIQEIPEIKKYFCDMVVADIRSEDSGHPYSSVLVLRDLKPDGFYMIYFYENMSMEHFCQGLDFLSMLHAGSLALEKKNNASLISQYSWFPKWYIPIAPGENRQEPTLLSFFTLGFPHLFDLLALNPNVKEGTIASLKDIQKNSKHVFHSMLEAGQDFPCLVHMDLWSHNLMVQDDDNVPIKAIDWQMMGYTDPIFDLTNYVILCLPLEFITKAGVQKAVEEYFANFSRLRVELGLQEGRNWEEFQRFFKTYGLTYGFVWIVMSSSTLISDSKYEPKFHKIFEFLVEMNVIEFVKSLIK